MLIIQIPTQDWEAPGVCMLRLLDFVVLLFALFQIMTVNYFF